MKVLKTIMYVFCISGWTHAYQMIFNPFTSKLDYVGVSSGSLPSGSTQYIQNTSTLQSGATFYVSSGTASEFNASTASVHRYLFVSDNIGVSLSQPNPYNLFINPPSNLNLNAVTGKFNLCMNGACALLTASDSNTCFGAGSCGSITDGDVPGCGVGVGNNLGFGDDCFHLNNGCFNVGMGPQVGQYFNNNANFNTIVGARAASGPSTNPLTSGSGITSVGWRTGFSNSTGTSTQWASFGAESWVSGDNQLSLCSDTYPCSTIWLGSPQRTTNNTDGQSVLFQVQQASGTNRTGGNLTLASGVGTGTGTNGSIYFQAANPGSTGTTLNSLVTIATVAASGVTITTVTIGTRIVWPDGTIQISSPAASSPNLIPSTNTWTGTNYFSQIIYISTTIGDAAPSNINTFINGGNTTLTGNRNVMLGAGTGAALTSGSSNMCFGAQACNKIQDGSQNAGIGDAALANEVSGANNTMFGQLAGTNMTGGDNNTGIGRGSLYNNLTGSRNTALGQVACQNTSAETALDNVICIGNSSRVDTSNTMAIGEAANPLTDVYMNSVNNGLVTNGASITFHAQDSSGTNRTGGNFTIAAGRGSGTGAGGWINLQVSTGGVTGSAQNALRTVLSISTATFGLAGQAMCWKTDTTLGYCSTIIGVTGGCTCN